MAAPAIHDLTPHGGASAPRAELCSPWTFRSLCFLFAPGRPAHDSTRSPLLKIRNNNRAAFVARITARRSYSTLHGNVAAIAVTLLQVRYLPRVGDIAGRLVRQVERKPA